MKRTHRLRGRTVLHRLFAVMAATLMVAGSAELAMAQEVAQTAGADSAPKATGEAPKQVFSGLQPGEKVKPFTVLRVQDDKAKEFEVAQKKDDGTTLICFVHRLSNDDRILFGLGLVDFYAAKHKDLTSHIVLLSKDREKIMTMLRRWSKASLFPKSQLGLSVDGAEGPGYYGLNRKVAMTVLVANGTEVVDNLVFQAPNQRDLHAIIKSVAKAQGKPAPSLEKVQQELRADRQRQMDKRIKGSPVFKIAPNEDLGRMMYGLVNGRGNRSLQASRRSKQLVAWAGEDEKRQSALKKYCQAVLDGSFNPDRYAVDALKKLVAD